MLDAQLYDLTQGLGGAYAQAANAIATRENNQPPTPAILQVQAGRAESPGWFMVQALEFDPQPMTSELLRVRDIYASPQIVHAILNLLVAQTWLDRQQERYTLTKNGREFLSKRRARTRSLLSKVDQAVAAESDVVERILKQFRLVMEASQQSATPPGTWCLDHSRHRAPDGSAPLSAHIFQFVADCNAFRDDAHMAAWQPTGLLGFEWEAFSFIVTQQASTATTLFESLAYRGYTVADYEQSLETLAQKNWIQITSQGAEVTTAGQDQWKEIEICTDAYFFKPWTNVLSTAEIKQFSNDMSHLIERLAIVSNGN